MRSSISQVLRVLTDDLGFLDFSLAQRSHRLDDRWRGFHFATNPLWLLILGEETTKERWLLFLKVRIEVFTIVDGVREGFTSLGVDLFWGFVGVHSFIDNTHGFVAAEEVGVGGVDVASLHRHHVRDELVGGCHATFKEVDHDEVESVFELGVAFEGGLLAKFTYDLLFCQEAVLRYESTRHTPKRNISDWAPRDGGFAA